MSNHPVGGKKLEVLGVRIAEQHHHPILAFVVMPLAARLGDVAIGVPDPVSLDNFGGWLEANLRAPDRAFGPIALGTTNHFDFVIIEAVLGQVTVAILKVAVGAVDTAVGE